MSSSLARILFIVLVGILTIALTILVPGSQGALAPQPIDDLVKAASAVLLALYGLPAMFSAILAILEFYGKVTPGGSDTLQMYFNAALYIACFLAVLFGKTELLFGIDKYLSGIAPILVALLTFLTGGVTTIVQTRRFLNHIRLLYPVRLHSRSRIA